MELLTNMDVLHPEVLRQHCIVPEDYKSRLVFRSAVESIRGTFIASSATGRQGLVRDVLENLRHRSLIVDFNQTSGTSRCDFEVTVRKRPDYFAAIEVKGGEGNSINISDRPVWAKEFAVWCHLDGAIVNQPEHGAHSIVNRLTNELVRRGKLVDVLLFKDVLCGTPTRPCPKYPGQEDSIGLLSAPDVFLFPRRVPSLDDPSPPVHTLRSLRVPRAILSLFDVPEGEQHKHIWEVHVRLIKLPKGRVQRKVEVRHEGSAIDESTSRSWKA